MLSRVIVALLVSTPSLMSGQPAAVRLRPPDARVAEQFTNLTSIRELPDDRVLVTDRKDARLVVVDFATGSVRPLGRRGSGPAEYADLGPAFALNRDSSLVIDIGNARWLLLAGDRIVATLPPDTPATQQVLFWVPFGADTFGHVLSMQLRRRGRPDAPWDSVDLTRIARRTGRVDVIGALRYGVPTRGAAAMSAAPGGRGVSVGRPPYNVREEQPRLFDDGWIAVARYEPYRVDWRAPDGTWMRGSALPVRPVPLTAHERAAYLRRHPGASEAGQWPIHVPPFDKTSPLLGAPEGWLVIPRVPTADEPRPRYDLVDRRSRLRAQLALADGERLLAFGERYVYVVVTDSDRIERLQRHPWP